MCMKTWPKGRSRQCCCAARECRPMAIHAYVPCCLRHERVNLHVHLAQGTDESTQIAAGYEIRSHHFPRATEAAYARSLAQIIHSPYEDRHFEVTTLFINPETSLADMQHTPAARMAERRRLCGHITIAL